MDMMHEASMDMLPKHVIFAMPQGTSLGSGHKPQLKEGGMEYDPASDDDLANNVASIVAAGKEESDKMTPVLVGGDYEDAAGGYLNTVLPLAQMHASITAYLSDYQRTPNPNIIGKTALSVMGEILSCSILNPSRGLSTISRESSRFAALSDDWKRNICWELLEDIHPRGEVYKTGRIPDNHDSYTGYYARPSLTWREEAGVLPVLAARASSLPRGSSRRFTMHVSSWSQRVILGSW
jgi:hypothetical protein